MDAPMRIDKWLWASRLSKTRALAAEAVKSGRVKVNGAEAKPSKDVKPGDKLELRTGPVRVSVVIRGTAPRRGPASEAQLLYEETEESREARIRHAEERRLARQEGGEGGRPTKRDRRRLEQVKGARRRDDR
jgi:ribosome-associated heat shock protein Hsp15